MKTHSLILRTLCLFMALSGSCIAWSSPFPKAKKVAASKVSSLPVDPQVTIGKLSNGFTYYIRKNTEPKNRVVMYLVNKVGSILEQDNEQGLAHFMEHMSFKGTKHYPENELISYLQKSGVKFGSDLNAYTSFDETVYQLPLPTDDPELLKNGFQIMRDWARDALIDSLSYEKERGVILEEKRLRTNVQSRLQKQISPFLLNGSPYVNRQPIGVEDVIKHASRQVIEGFYHRWYRPNLQALIVVGDIDVAATEKTIKGLFSDLKNPKAEVARPKYDIPLLNKNQFALVTDKELSVPMIQVMMKFQKQDFLSIADYKRNICNSFFNYILSERFSDLSKKANSPFLNAGANVGSVMVNIDAFTVQMAAKPEKMEEAFKTVWSEILRAKKQGFTEAELNRVKQGYEKNFDNNYAERSKTPSSSYVEEYMRNFLTGEPIPGIEYEYSLCKKLISEITLQDVNACAQEYIKDTNRDIFVVGPDKDKNQLPSESAVVGWMKEVDNQSLAALKDEETNQPLLDNKPTGGKVVSETKDAKLGTITLELSNGVKVILKPTDFKNDEISFKSTSPGGTSLYSDKDYFSATVASDLVDYSGLNQFDQTQLRKYMTGKQASANPYIGDRFEGINGGSSVADFETAMQLVYLYFTAPRKDVAGFQQELERSKASLANRSDNPNAVFSDTISAVLGNYNIRRTGPSAQKIDQINLDRAFEIYKERFANAGDFTFTFVGNIDVEKMKPIIAQYLGTLPSTGRKEEARDLGIRFPKGKVERTVKKGEEAKSTVRLIYSGKYNYSDKENVRLSALADLLSLRLLETLRMQESGVYGVSASPSFTKYPENFYTIGISFGCAPENVEKLIASANRVVADLQQVPPTAEEIQKVISEDKRAFELSLKDNSFWLGYISSRIANGENPEGVFDYDTNLNELTPAVLVETAKKYLTGENYARFVLSPENKK